MDVQLHQLTFFIQEDLTLEVPEWKLEREKLYLLSGPTGSGKTTLAKWIAGWELPHCRISLASGVLAGKEYSEADFFLQALREQFAPLYLLQDAYTIFNPYVSIGKHFRDVWRAQKGRSVFRNLEEVWSCLRKTGVPADKNFLKRRAHQISQGEAQRCAFVLSLIRSSGFLILDEIISNVDSESGRRMMEILEEWRKKTNAVVIFISHDVRFLNTYADASFQIKDGELGRVRPSEHPFQAEGNPVFKRRKLIQLEGLRVFKPGRNKSKKQEILWQADSFYCDEEEVLGMTGISGTGKTTLLLGLMGIRHLEWARYFYRGKDWKDIPDHRKPDIRYLLQSVVSGFNPVQTIRKSIREIERVHRYAHSDTEKLMSYLRLDPSLLDRMPGQVSGGEIQRFGVLTMLIGDPDLILFDESFSSVDYHTRAEVWQVVRRIQKEKGFSVIVVSHDIPWLKRQADRVVYMDRREAGSVS